METFQNKQINISGKVQTQQLQLLHLHPLQTMQNQHHVYRLLLQRQLQAHSVLAIVQSHLRNKVNMLQHHKTTLLLATVNGIPPGDAVTGEGGLLHGRVETSRRHRA